MHKNFLLAVLAVMLVFPAVAQAEERLLDGRPATESLKVVFNGEKLKSYYSVVDARTEAEKAADQQRGALAGPVILFLTGHAQRPADAWKFSNDLALKSKSGVVLVPVVDTPYGDDEEWRGDRGKDVILMGITRYLLAGKGMKLNNYVPLTDMEFSVVVDEVDLEDPADAIGVDLIVVGWSHGGLLTRRITSAYPDTVVGMGQVCPAGYADWKHGGFSMLMQFSWESLRIGTLAFKGHADDVAGASWGITKGMVGDSCRGFGSSVVGLEPGRMFRYFKDIGDCAIIGSDENLPVSGITHAVTVFGIDDTVFPPSQSGVTSVVDTDMAEVDAFWQKFYPILVSEGAQTSLRFLPGMHLAPVSHHEIYSDEILIGLGQLR